MKTILTGLLILGMTASSFAQSKVYVTEHGKRYHLDINCMSLSKSKVLTIDIKDIKDRTICLICKHRHDKKK